MMHKILAVSLLFSSFLMLSFQNKLFSQPPGKGYKLLFEDNFDGNKIRENDWYYRTDRRQGGSFNALNRKENVSISGGYLHVTVRQDTINGIAENTGGGLISKRQFGYGYYECLSKPFMAGTGVHTAFWQAGGSDSAVYNKIFEIDSYEIDSKTFLGDNNLYVHISPKQYNEIPWPHRAKIPMSYREDGWLLDAFEYTPEGVTFYDNGKVVAKAEWKELTAAQKVWLTALNGFGKIEKDKQPGESLFDYFRYYAKDYPGVNILPNGNFEYNQDKIDSLLPVSWRINGTPGSSWVSSLKSFRDHYCLKQGSESSDYSADASQQLEFIMNGSYRLTARVRSSGGQKTAKLFVADYGGKQRSIDIKTSTEWMEISIENIMVSNNGINVGVRSEGNSGQWLEIDDIQLFKPDSNAKTKLKPEPFTLIGDPIWHLAKKDPIRFMGDQKFYFFDRNVGFGEAISISFTMSPDTVANMTPISKIPQKGNAGWALQLTENGALIFRIGSQEDHKDVIANDVYKKGKKSTVVCLFNKGTAEIFVDGVMVKREVGILQLTNDKSVGGRIGDVGEQLQVIADVFIPVKGDQSNNNVQQNITRYRGTLQNIGIYNRALTKNEIVKK